MKPSGRTEMVEESSGLRHTTMFKTSSGPIVYATSGALTVSGAGGYPEPEAQPASANTAASARPVLALQFHLRTCGVSMTGSSSIADHSAGRF